MEFSIGDFVTRKSHNNDILFIITDIDEDDICYLKGVNVRLCADSDIDDLVKQRERKEENDEKYVERIKKSDLERTDYFYLPGKILHIDGDVDYLNRCLNFYEKANLLAQGITEKEEDIADNIRNLLEEYNPSIVVITGHDAFYRKPGKNTYKNSQNFIKAVKEARKFESSHEKLIIIAGACQSNYEELIKAGANFASSPKRINIHALDPAIIASSLALTDHSKDIDVKTILENTKYGKDGLGGIKTKGTMYVGYPR